MNFHSSVGLKSKHGRQLWFMKRLCAAFVLALLSGAPKPAVAQEPLQLDKTCTVTLGNQTAVVRPDGSFLIRNIAIFVPGQIRNVVPNVQDLPLLHRVRATCVRDGQTVTGQTEFFELTPGQVKIVGDIFPAELDPIPVRISATAGEAQLGPGQSTQLTVIATLPDDSTQNVTSRSQGTTYLTTNAGLLTVSEEGLVTGANNGSVIGTGTIVVLNEGNFSTVRIAAFPDSDDFDNDGMPNDFEDLFGLDKFSNDANGDLDADGLTNLEEFNLGSIVNNPDTDNDGIQDGLDGNPLVPENGPPTVVITSPEVDTLVETQDVTFSVDASDDGLLTTVQLAIQPIGISQVLTEPPFEVDVKVPTGLSQMTFTAIATDGVNNMTQEEVTVAVIPDPLTTVVGNVVDPDNAPVAGADITTNGNITGTTRPDGSFSISGVPTARGDIVVVAENEIDGNVLRGQSDPVRAELGGTTDVGILQLLGSTYYGFNPANNGTLRLVGWADNTTIEVINLDNGSVVVSETISRFQARNIGLGGTRHFKVEASSPLQATLGFDCCNFGGSFFYPAIDGRRLVGREFVIRIPVLSGSNEFVTFAHENSEITIRDTAGNVVLAQTLAKDGFWSTTGGPLAAGSVYQVESTGDIALMSNSNNAHTPAPSREGTDVGTEFLLATSSWSATAIAVFAYEDADVVAVDLTSGGEAFRRTLAAGELAYINTARSRFKITGTGKISVWGGSTEGGNSIAAMGDDLTMNTGDDGKLFFIHTQSQGGFVFATADNTSVDVDGVVTILDEGQFIDLGANRFVRIESDKPVVVETIGGNGLNDWETGLRLVP